MEKRRNNPTGHSLVRAVRHTPPPSPKPEGLGNYHPFVSKGFVSFSEGGYSVAVKILRDTGATQSLMASHVLMLSEQTSVDASVLIQGVGMDVLRVPLHQIHLQSDLISGPVVVRVRPNLPVKGVSLILGNDLAGGKVQPHLQVISDTGQVLCSSSAVDGPSQGKISCKFLHVLCTERALKMSPFLQETCKTCKNRARNFTFLAQFLASSKNLVRNLQGARILHVKCLFSCSVSRILQDIFPWVLTLSQHV